MIVDNIIYLFFRLPNTVRHLIQTKSNWNGANSRRTLEEIFKLCTMPPIISIDTDVLVRQAGSSSSSMSYQERRQQSAAAQPPKARSAFLRHTLRSSPRGIPAGWTNCGKMAITSAAHLRSIKPAVCCNHWLNSFKKCCDYLYGIYLVVEMQQLAWVNYSFNIYI